MKKKSGKRYYTPEEKKELLRAFRAHSGPKIAFFQRRKISGAVIYGWLAQNKAARKQGAKPAPARKPARRSTRAVALSRKPGPYSPDKRRQAVEAFLKSGLSYKDFGKIWGINAKMTLPRWVKAYQQGGPRSLENTVFGKGAKRGPKGIAAPLRAEIIEVKRSYPYFGWKSLRDFLMRFRGLRVSIGTIRKTVVQAQLPSLPAPEPKVKRAKDQIRFFERARPMQLWQTDITSFVLTRHSTRVYLTVFMDDNSRYIVSWALMLRQTGEFVMDALLSGIQRFGKPEEVLTDQGRQYFSWRGKSDFQKLLDREGIRHVVSRSHHPETLGKCERFWETVSREFWDRVKPQELNDARERLGQFIAHYNHFRPHQGIGGLVPADKFFGLENEIRRTIEETVDRNALRLALGEAPKSPVFLIGQIGDQPVSMHGESGHLVIQTPDGKQQRLDYETFGRKSEFGKQAVELISTGENDGKDGKAEPGVGIQEERRQAGAQEGLSSPDEARGAGEVALGVGHARAEGEGASIGGSPHGVLDGAHEQAGGIAEALDPAASRLAAVPTGDVGYGGRVVDTTQSPSQGSTTDGSTRRPKAAAEEDRGARAPHPDAGPVDLGSSRDAGVPGREHPDGGASDAGHTEEGTSGECSNRSEGQEGQDGGTDGSSR
jgi:transposase InsO family protein